MSTKVHLVKAMVFPAVMYGCESWTIKKVEHWRINAFELWCCRVPWIGSPVDCKEIKPVNPKENQPWILIGRTDTKAETPTLWPPDVKNLLVGKDPEVGKDWRQDKKEMAENKMVGWHYQLDGHEFEQAPSWWWTAKPGMLQSMGSQRVRRDWATEVNKLNWSRVIIYSLYVLLSQFGTSSLLHVQF